jgi:restriction system protein
MTDRELRKKGRRGSVARGSHGVSEVALPHSAADAGRIWFVRAGGAGSAARAFVDEGFVGIAWSEIGSLAGVTDLRAIEVRLADVFPDKSRRTLTAWAAMLRAICATMTRGDTVMTIQPEARRYWLGKISSDYRWVRGTALAHRRQVSWTGSLERSCLSESTLHCLGAISTVFRLSTAATDEVVGQFRGLGASRASARESKETTHG